MMKKLTAAAVLLGSFFSASSSAALLFDQDVTANAIFGSGNTNGSFTLDRSGGVELGLRGKLRHNFAGAPENTFNSNGDGTYTFDAGVAPGQVFPTGVWSFEWSINTDYDDSTGMDLDDLTYLLHLDSDPSAGVDMFSFDPMLASNNPGGFWDHSIGDNTTAQGAGDEATDAATYGALVSANNLAQNSWKAHWYIPDFDPTVDATYDISLSAFNSNGEVARSSIQIIVGEGGATDVPEPAPIALMLSALLGLVIRRKMRAK